MTLGMLVVLGVIVLAIVLFFTEVLPVEVTALLIMVILILLGPWTQVSVEEGFSGFSNNATLTVLAMLILSEGVRRTGLVPIVANWAGQIAGKSQRRQLAMTITMGGPLSGFINNTPVVALLVPVINKMAHSGNTSPSKLLMPLSFASMLGGTLTLIGTSSNLLASDVSGRLIGHEFSMFEFTPLGVIVLITGSVFLFFAAPRLLPARVEPRESFVDSFGMEGYLTEVQVAENSPLIGQSLAESLLQEKEDFELVRVKRGDDLFQRSFHDLIIQAGDEYLIRASQKTLTGLMEAQGLEIAPHLQSDEASLYSGRDDAEMAQIIIPRNSDYVGKRLGGLSLTDDHALSVLALRRKRENIVDSLDKVQIRPGDLLLAYGPKDTFDTLAREDDTILVNRLEPRPTRHKKIPLAIAIIVAVVALAALDVFPILVTAFAGAVLMMLTGIVRPSEIYDSLRWEVYFLLAGIIPLGIALENTGTAEYLGQLIASTGDVLPPLLVLWIFYIFTGLITAVISNNASVILMLPLAIEAAQTLEVNPFAFVLAVTFAASTAFLSPMGYQTNLFVYGPGNYRMTDFLRLGAPLQLVLSIVTALGIALFWGL